MLWWLWLCNHINICILKDGLMEQEECYGIIYSFLGVHVSILCDLLNCLSCSFVWLLEKLNNNNSMVLPSMKNFFK